MIQELQLTVSTEDSNVEAGEVLDLNKLHVDYQPQPLSSPYYKDANFESVLQSYANDLEDSNILIPIGALKSIRKLHDIANNNLFIIASDKAYTQLSELEGLNTPSIAFHGSFSMMVNFDAIARYFRLLNGDAFFQTPRKGLKTCTFVSNREFSNLFFSREANQMHLESFAPADYFSYHRQMCDNLANYSLEALAAHLNLSGWDPYVFNKMMNKVNQDLSKAPQLIKDSFSQGMVRMAGNFYYMPSSQDYLFDIAVFFHTLQDYANAKTYYQQSLNYFGENFNVIYNLGLCFYYLGDKTEALTLFEKAKQLSPTSREVSDWIEFVKNELR